MVFEHGLSTPAKIVAGCMLSAAWLWMPGCGSDSSKDGQSATTGGSATSTGGAAATTGGSAGKAATTGGAAATTGGAATTTGGAATTTGGAATTTGGTPSTGGQATGGTPTGGASNCAPPATGGPTGMNDGMACLGCHASAQAPTMTVAGTLYSATSGGTAVSGATVKVTDSNNAVLTLVTGSTGNFYSSSAVAFPASVSVSQCPDTVPMNSPVNSGDCNSCHGSTFRVHLP
jgi:hypothetical protein